jgi:hypothetical protein
MLVRRKNKSCVLITWSSFQFGKRKIPRKPGDCKKDVHNRYRWPGFAAAPPLCPDVVLGLAPVADCPLDFNIFSATDLASSPYGSAGSSANIALADSSAF